MKTVYLKVFSFIPYIIFKSGHTAFFSLQIFIYFPIYFQCFNWSIFLIGLKHNSTNMQTMKKIMQILWLKTSIFQIFRKIVKLAYTLLYYILQVFEEEKCPKTYTTPLPCFQKKLKNMQQDTVKQPANCINKTKRDVKKKFNNPQNFIQRN